MKEIKTQNEIAIENYNKKWRQIKILWMWMGG